MSRMYQFETRVNKLAQLLGDISSGDTRTLGERAKNLEDSISSYTVQIDEVLQDIEKRVSKLENPMALASKSKAIKPGGK